MTKKNPTCDETIHENGFRFTPQRREVYNALMAKRDHPTAVEVFTRVKEKMPNISLATVYNCLETLAECGLVRQVNLDRASARFCANKAPHGHFFCDECGAVFDVPVPKPNKLEQACEVPEKTIVSQLEVTLRGLCPECAQKKPEKTNL